MTGAVTLITGGASGIGAATARRFHRAGGRIVIADRDTAAGEAVAAEVDGVYIPVDVGEPADSTRAVTATVEAFGRLDNVVLNAAGIRINALCPGLVDTAALAPHRQALRGHGLRLADPEAVAAAIETVLADPATGQVWAVQAGQPAAVVAASEVPLAAE